MADFDREVRARIAEMGYPGQPSHPVCHGVGARAHEPPYPHQAGGGAFEENMVLAVEPGVYWKGGGGLRIEDNFLVTATGTEKLSPFPDGVVEARRG
jgi:Xaa-Pro aminopeptidase